MKALKFIVEVHHYKPKEGMATFHMSKVNIFDIVSIGVPAEIASEFCAVYTGKIKKTFNHRFPYQVKLLSGTVYFCSNEGYEALLPLVEFRDFMLKKLKKEKSNVG